MVIKRSPLPYDVVEGARRRVLNLASNGVPLYLSMSGGKDSIVLAHVVYSLVREGRIDPSMLRVLFLDEEAIFDSVERIVRDWRKRFLAVGADFRWYCIEVKHFNCFNSLSQDESFICWDSTARDRWVRPMPPFAITDHPDLRRRVDSYQDFFKRINRDGAQLGGVRVAESLQRLQRFSLDFNAETTLFSPLYDWKDTDVWRYIAEHDLDFPETYLHLYQTGSNRRQMRISQFFSADTARSLVRLDEHEPDLMARVVRREPNAYLAALYWDTEMFRSSGGSGEARSGKTTEERGEEFRTKVLAILRDPGDAFDVGHKADSLRLVRKTVVRFATFFETKDWKTAYDILVGGDPKNRLYRALLSHVASSVAKDDATPATATTGRTP